MADKAPTLLALAAEANDEIVHRRGCGKAPGMTDEPHDSDPQRDMCTRDLLCMFFAPIRLRGGEQCST